MECSICLALIASVFVDYQRDQLALAFFLLIYANGAYLHHSAEVTERQRYYYETYSTMMMLTMIIVVLTLVKQHKFKRLV